MDIHSRTSARSCLLFFAWSTFSEIRGFKMLQIHSDGFLPVIDINIMNQAVKGTSKPCLKEVEGVVYINCAHKSGGHWASDIEKHFQLTTFSARKMLRR